MSFKRRGKRRAQRVFRGVCGSSRVRSHDSVLSAEDRRQVDRRDERARQQTRRHVQLFATKVQKQGNKRKLAFLIKILKQLGNYKLNQMEKMNPDLTPYTKIQKNHKLKHKLQNF